VRQQRFFIRIDFVRRVRVHERIDRFPQAPLASAARPAAREMPSHARGFAWTDLRVDEGDELFIDRMPGRITQRL
jgi:hypothetical protein